MKFDFINSQLPEMNFITEDPYFQDVAPVVRKKAHDLSWRKEPGTPAALPSCSKPWCSAAVSPTGTTKNNSCFHVFLRHLG